MKKWTILIFVLFLVGCTSQSLETQISQLGSTPREMLTTISEQFGTEREYSVSVFDDRMVFKNDTEEVVIDLTDEDFYLAVAPYVTDTHT